jgi:hypothetical protein
MSSPAVWPRPCSNGGSHSPNLLQAHLLLSLMPPPKRMIGRGWAELSQLTSSQLGTFAKIELWGMFRSSG